MGLLSVADAAAWALYCDAAARARECDEAIAKQGLVVRAGNGGVKTNPHLQIANRCRAFMLKVLSEFGLTPSSRSHVKVDAPAEPDTLTAFLARKP